jgi:plasmid stabilization system protein ParE
MTLRYRILPAADRDLDDHAAHLAAEASLETALRFYDAAGATFSRIASMPGIGEQWQSADPRRCSPPDARRGERMSRYLLDTGIAFGNGQSSRRAARPRRANPPDKHSIAGKPAPIWTACAILPRWPRSPWPSKRPVEHSGPTSTP